MAAPERRKSRNGFTLIEVLVALVLLSILAAAVYPVVTQQVAQGDPVRVTQDLGSIRAGLEQFSLDVRPSLPSDLEDLVNKVVSGDAADNDTTITYDGYSTGQIARWNGPYIDSPLAAANRATGAAFATGYSGKVQNELKCYEPAGDTVRLSTTVRCSTGDMVAVMIIGPNETEFQTIDKLMDGSDGTSSGNLTAGKLRFHDAGTNPGTGSDTIFYLALPFK